MSEGLREEEVARSNDDLPDHMDDDMNDDIEDDQQAVDIADLDRDDQVVSDTAHFNRVVGPGSSNEHT